MSVLTNNLMDSLSKIKPNIQVSYAGNTSYDPCSYCNEICQSGCDGYCSNENEMESIGY